MAAKSAWNFQKRNHFNLTGEECNSVIMKKGIKRPENYGVVLGGGGGPMTKIIPTIGLVASPVAVMALTASQRWGGCFLGGASQKAKWSSLLLSSAILSLLEQRVEKTNFPLATANISAPVAQRLAPNSIPMPSFIPPVNLKGPAKSLEESTTFCSPYLHSTQVSG
ncbi:UNVERIFIED_CONTAM: hypothetical protein K2H54_020247 [Gekko kuhli]